ncbi:glutaredoxin family protein [Collimonas pratensis]|uniref:Glutaredoxin family protein n=1 Tax=Collimonas pratensis TaxID=279113 RepID=A0A127Q093_9BURK|nr:glutaredoxin family protein [Collimonas pratensis]AMP03447.1 glutaredoxin family protein [Collimonas pratensis]
MTIGITMGIRSAATFFLLMLATSAQAQLYKSTGPDGKVTYSDTPPASGNVVQKKIGGGGDDTDGLPYELALAVKNHPVTLYSSDKCIPCDDGRKMLKERGIPFSEKTVKTNEDIAALRKIASDSQLPVLTVGRDKQSGFSSATWGSALSTAGYPESSRLPANYSNAAPVAAAQGARPAAKTTAPAATANSGDVPPATGNAPPGFRF